MSRVNLGPILSDYSIDEFCCSASRGLKVAHFNAQSLCPSDRSHKIDELAAFFRRGSLDIICVTETWLNPFIFDRAVGLSGYSVLRSDRPLGYRGGGVAIYVNEGLRYKVISRSTDYFAAEGLFIKIEGGSTDLCIGAVYLPRGDLNMFEYTFGDILVRFSNLIIAGDFNCNLFDSSKSAELHRLCGRFGLTCLHNSLPTHFDPFHQSTSLIDFFLVNRDMKIGSSAQFQIPLISYHSLICASFVFPMTYSSNHTFYRDFKKANMPAIVNHIAGYDFSLLYSTSNTDEQLSFFNNLFLELLEFVPTVRAKYSGMWRRPRFSSEINYYRSLTSIALRTFYRSRSDVNWDIYRRLRNVTKSKIRKFRRDYCCRLFGSCDSRKMWNCLRYAGISEGVDTLCDLDVNEINDCFISNQLPTAVGVPDFSSFSDLGFSFSNIDESTLVSALSNVNSTSVGSDGISIKLIKTVFPFISNHLLHCLNCILMTSSYPSSWKIARIIPIPKNGRQLFRDNMRPISILPALSKIFEVIMKMQLMKWIDSRALLNDCQYGFRSGCCTSDLLIDMTDSIRSNLNRGDLSVLVSVDLSKAFDRVDHSLLVAKLGNFFGFSSSACRLIWSYLNGRGQFVSLNCLVSDVRPVRSGVPQGSIIGPILFSLFLNDVFDVLVHGRAFAFADDIQLLWTGNFHSFNTLCATINNDLSVLNCWMDSNRLLINPEKTKAIVFGANRFGMFDLDLRISGSAIRLTSSMKCLGVIIDENLSFEPHIDFIFSRVCFTLRRLYHLNLFLPLHVRKRVAHALLMSQINYCFGVYSGCNLGGIGRIKSIIHKIVRFVYGIRPRHHVSNYVKNFLKLSFECYLKFRLLIYLYNIIKNQGPAPVVRLLSFSRSTRNPQIHIPRIYNSFFERSFVVRVARLWNMLPLRLRSFASSTFTFKRRLILFLNGIY